MRTFVRLLTSSSCMIFMVLQPNQTVVVLRGFTHEFVATATLTGKASGVAVTAISVCESPRILLAVGLSLSGPETWLPAPIDCSRLVARICMMGWLSPINRRLAEVADLEMRLNRMQTVLGKRKITECSAEQREAAVQEPGSSFGELRPGETVAPLSPPPTPRLRSLRPAWIPFSDSDSDEEGELDIKEVSTLRAPDVQRTCADNRFCCKHRCLVTTIAPEGRVSHFPCADSPTSRRPPQVGCSSNRVAAHCWEIYRPKLPSRLGMYA